MDEFLQDLVDWLPPQSPDLAPLVLIAVGVWWMMPRGKNLPKVVGIVLALAGAAWLAVRLGPVEGSLDETIVFSMFAAAAILCAVLMITNRNPVYSALWFALATLSTCGLFLLQSAPFLAAATVIVYAGAIVVTFLFVIMLAQQAGATVYDQRSRQPLLATFAAFFLLAMLLGTLQASRSTDIGLARGGDVASVANPLSQVKPDAPFGTMHGLGRSLFGDYLFAVELAGTLLLIATIGAIAIAPRRRRGTL
jgi:NADH-quinone oxidoreductase subunit J